MTVQLLGGELVTFHVGPCCTVGHLQRALRRKGGQPVEQLQLRVGGASAGRVSGRERHDNKFIDGVSMAGMFSLLRTSPSTRGGRFGGVGSPSRSLCGMSQMSHMSRV